MFISIKTTSPYEGNSRAETIVNSGTQFSVCLGETVGARLHHIEEKCAL